MDAYSLPFIMLFAQKQRLDLINKIKKTFIEADLKGLAIGEEKLIASLCCEHGCTKRKAKEYINDLLMAEFIVKGPEGLELHPKQRTVKP